MALYGAAEIARHFSILAKMFKHPPGASQGAVLDGLMAPGLARQGLMDLAKRCERGIFFHLPLWLLVAVGSGLVAECPLFCAINGVIFFATTVARLVLRRHFQSLVKNNDRLARRFLMITLLAACVHWGVLTGSAMHFPALASAEYPLLFVAVGLASSGAMNFAISPFLRLWYPACMLAPMGIAMLIDSTSLHILMALMSVILIAYLYSISQMIHADYWEAANARFKLEERTQELEKLSVTDALTQIHNRLYFEHQLAAEWSRAAHETYPLSALMVDLDFFKKVNDSYGHPFGDLCLAAAAQALRSGLHRGTDVVARYGGEEFAVLLPGTNAASAQIVANRLLHCVANVSLMRNGEPVRITCSIGVSTVIPSNKLPASWLVSHADNALYLAKQQGRNRVVMNTEK